MRSIRDSIARFSRFGSANARIVEYREWLEYRMCDYVVSISWQLGFINYHFILSPDSLISLPVCFSKTLSKVNVCLAEVINDTRDEVASRLRDFK